VSDNDEHGELSAENLAGLERLADYVDPAGRKLGEDPRVRIQRMHDNPPPLHRDLRAWLYTSGALGGQSLKHPLLFDVFYNPSNNARLNEIYRIKRKEADKLLKQRKFSSYVWWHERAYRLDAFVGVMEELDDKDYWELLANIWSDSENIHQNFLMWRDCLEAEDRSSRELFMSEEDRVRLAELHLAETVTIFRGYCVSEGREGMSWTLDHDRAAWFASRFAGAIERSDCCEVAHATIKAENIIAFVSARGEDEIVALPEDVQVFKIETIKP